MSIKNCLSKYLSQYLSCSKNLDNLVVTFYWFHWFEGELRPEAVSCLNEVRMRKEIISCAVYPLGCSSLFQRQSCALRKLLASFLLGSPHGENFACGMLWGVDYYCRTALAAAGLVKAMGCQLDFLQEQKHYIVTRLVHKQRIQTFLRAIPKQGIFY